MKQSSFDGSQVEPASGGSANGPRRKGRTTVLTGLVALGSVVCVVAGATLLYGDSKVKENRQPVEVAPQVANEPMNVLLLGSDSREGLTPDQLAKFGGTQRVTGRRADTIILLHLDERRDKAVLVHIPRDLLVEDPSGKPVKINAFYSRGLDAMIQAVSQFTGLPIHHYVEMDFNGFNEIVDTLGGVQIYFEKAVSDEDSGLSQPQGCVNIAGDQALAFVRARKIDDDFGRIQRQQLFIKLMADKIATPAVALRPDRIVSLVNALSRSVRYDTELSLPELTAIGLRLRKLNSSNMDMRVVPSAGAWIDGVSYVVADDNQTRELFSALAERKPLPDYGYTGVSAVDPKDVSISVLNGTGVEHLELGEAELLKSRGFQVLETSTTTPHEATTVYYSEGYEQRARMLADNYGAFLQRRPADLPASGRIAVVLGADFAASHRSVGPPRDEAAEAIYVPAQHQVRPVQLAAARPLVRPCQGD